jgi:murein DD-endopeptidase MepM/ murein hydrolase activator NlpD
MAQGCGSTIFAAGPGTVITAGEFYGWGNTVRVNHGDGLITLYGHMQWNSLRVTVGDAVTAGTPLGAEGNTGRSFGCHLHFEVQRDGIAVDPQPFMAALGLPLK